MIPLVAMAAANVVASLKKEKEPFTLSEIAEATAEEYAIPTVRLLGKGCESVQEEARRVALYLSAKVASPEEIAAFFGCEVPRIEVPEGEARQRMSRIETKLRGRQSDSNPLRSNSYPRPTSSVSHCFVKRALWSKP